MKPSRRYPNEPKMVIYQILNLSNGKSYVGQAMNGFYRRYHSRQWWKGVTCRHLKNAIAKYGHEVFEVKILERDVASEEELDRLEIEHIARIGCVHPHGYNYQAGGQVQRNRTHHRESRDHMAIVHSGGKVHRLLNNRTGVVHEFINIARFSEENNLTHSAVSILLSGRRSLFGTGQPYYSQHKEWSLPHSPIRRILCVSPEGEEHIVMDGVDGGVKGFCKRMGFKSTSHVFKAIKGDYPHACRWTFKVLPPFSLS